MRRNIVVATVGLLFASFLVLNSAEASVPGLPFTETGCEGYSDSVARLYTAGLDRDAEQVGFEYWLDLYKAGRLNLHKMAILFTESAEFDLRYGSLDNTGFVGRLYQNVLQRDGEPDGVDYWVGRLNGGLDRGSVLLMFAESPENISRSGTSQPTLGPFNSGLQHPWGCGAEPEVPTSTTTTTTTTTAASPPHGNRDIHNCGDFSTHAAAQRHFEALRAAGYGDPDRLDADNDGLACESLP